ncbi:hypothetical protein OIU85_019181 [Salix viminalis]|uniref:Uncharacterized protein n=1 Tax=Salix viminalis TaxID=40686 RepID=A0A9Q0ZJN4_SALVM|nr:hypothetical protein OIU85_019181 [Salix viminalis]
MTPLKELRLFSVPQCPRQDENFLVVECFCVVLPDNKEAAELFNNIMDENLSCLLRVTNTLAARMPCQTKSMLASGNGNLFQSKSDALLPEMRQSAKESF